MTKQAKASKNAMLTIGVIVVLVAIMLLAAGNDTKAPRTETPAPVDEVVAPVTETPALETAVEDDSEPAPATPAAPASSSEIDAALEALDSSLTEEDYDTSTVTELFDDTSAESLTDPYDI